MASNQEKREVGEVYPEDLLSLFSRGRIVLWMAAAVVIHVVVIGVTSVGYIRDQWIDPEGAKIRKETAEKAVAAEKAAARAAAKPAVTNTVAGSAATNAVSGTVTGAVPATVKKGAPEAAGDEAATLESRRETTVVKRITEATPTNEIPKEPDLGISLEDTNPH